MKGNLEVALAAVDSLFGSVSREAFLEQAPLPAIALRVLSQMSGQEHGIDPQGGLGLFHIDGYAGAVGLIAVSDVQRAMSAVRVHLLAVGATPAVAIGGAEALRMEDGALTVLLPSRGYLYMLMPDSADSSGSERTSEQVVALLRDGPVATLASTAAWRRVARGQGDLASVNLFANAAEAGSFGAEAVLVNLRAEPSKLVLGGLISTREPLRIPQPASAPHLLRAPEGPVVVASLWFEPDALKAAVLGPLGSMRRRLFGSRVEALGVNSEALFASLGGRVSLLAYFDGELSWLNVLQDQLTLPYARLLLETSLQRRAPLERYVQARLKDSGLTFRRTLRGSDARYTANAGGAELEVRLAEKRAQLSIGDARATRPETKLSEQLRSRFGQGPFGPGHASLLVDLGALRAELDRPIDLEGLPDEDARLLQQFAGLLLWQMGPIDHVFLDLGATPEGLKVRGEIVFEAPAGDTIGHR